MSSRRLCAELGISYRQLDYWCRCGLVPGQERGRGSGTPRRFTARQADVIRTIAKVARIRVLPLEILAMAIRAGECPCCGQAVA